MSDDAVPAVRAGTDSARALWAVWAGLAALAALPLLPLAREHWIEGREWQGPMLLALAAWLAFRRRDVLSAAAAVPAPRLGAALLAAALAVYLGAMRIDALSLQVLALVGTLLALLLLERGRLGAAAMALPLLLAALAVPWPAAVVDPLTNGLKAAVSAGAEELLHLAGYPVARSGVVLSVGPYELLVADACAGLNSLGALVAMGLLYLHLTPPDRAARLLLGAASLAPIAFAANVLRVCVLALVTFHWGDRAGQGFAHSAAGVVLFSAGLAMLILIDRFLLAPLPGKGRGRPGVAAITGAR
jgi:exosortase